MARACSSHLTMPKFPAFTDKEVVRKIKKCGFDFSKNCRGSHEMWVRDVDTAVIIVPRHAGKIIKRKTLKNIITATGLSIKEFIEL